MQGCQNNILDISIHLHDSIPKDKSINVYISQGVSVSGCCGAAVVYCAKVVGKVEDMSGIVETGAAVSDSCSGI